MVSGDATVEAIQPEVAASTLTGLVEQSLEWDAVEAPGILARLATPPPGRRTGWLRAGPREAPVGLLAASVNDTEPSVGHLDLVAVHPNHRRLGVGTELVTAAEAALHELGVREVRWSGNPPCYAWPGIDVRYTPAICCAEALGYERYSAAHNMVVDLADAGLSTKDEEHRLADTGVTVRRAGRDDLPALREWALRVWNASWAWEIEQSVLAEGAGLHIAVRDSDGAILAFAGHGANRPSWFGPMGTDPAARKLGLGRVLLGRCLADQRDAGLPTAQIGWTGPVSFYSRTVGARLDRVFWLYRKRI